MLTCAIRIACKLVNSNKNILHPIEAIVATAATVTTATTVNLISHFFTADYYIVWHERSNTWNALPLIVHIKNHYCKCSFKWIHTQTHTKYMKKNATNWNWIIDKNDCSTHKVMAVISVRSEVCLCILCIFEIWLKL